MARTRSFPESAEFESDLQLTHNYKKTTAKAYSTSVVRALRSIGHEGIEDDEKSKAYESEIKNKVTLAMFRASRPLWLRWKGISPLGVIKQTQPEHVFPEPEPDPEEVEFVSFFDDDEFDVGVELHPISLETGGSDEDGINFDPAPDVGDE